MQFLTIWQVKTCAMPLVDIGIIFTPCPVIIVTHQCRCQNCQNYFLHIIPNVKMQRRGRNIWLLRGHATWPRHGLAIKQANGVNKQAICMRDNTLLVQLCILLEWSPIVILWLIYTQAFVASVKLEKCDSKSRGKSSTGNRHRKIRLSRRNLTLF